MIEYVSLPSQTLQLVFLLFNCLCTLFVLCKERLACFFQFFLELHYYHKHVNGEPTSNIAQLEALRKADSDFAELEGTAFEEVTKIFESLCDNMIETLTTHCVHDLESNAYSYKKERYMLLHINLLLKIFPHFCFEK